MMEVSFTHSESDTEEILLPIASLFPPNQIISKNYAPDVKPVFKLIQDQKKLARRVTFNSDTRNNYCQIFGQDDTLGYQYLQLLKVGLVYLKFNNKNFLKLTLKNKSYNYFAGMFIPLESLLNEEIKQSRNIYKILPSTDYIDNSPAIDQSFNTNCFAEENQLKFTSNYQSSNLFAAFKRPDGEYDLVLQNDINSRGNTQWFNFTVGISEDKIYKFNIVNLTKSASLYQKGMSVALLSQQNKINNKIGWTRGCFNISYTQTPVTRQDNDRSYYYKLHFQYKPSYPNDVVTFAYCFPYTNIDLERFFQKILFKKIVHNLRIQRHKICETLSGFPVYVYSIINKKNLGPKKSASSKYFDQTSINIEPKVTPTKSLVFIARQHPGQSQGSYVLEGVVEFLMENNDYESYKRNYSFYVIPMVNIDGVFYGNYRTNLSGNDLNRVWRQPRKEYHSQIYFIKKFLFSTNKLSPISLIIDIHGHSNSLNSFFYGNPPKKETSTMNFENPKLFPYFCSKRVKQISFNQSTFSVSQDKKNCARVVLSEMFPKALVYTFQNSFYGWKKGKNIIQHTIESFKKLGRDLILSYLEYCRLGQKNIGIKQKWAKQIEQIVKQPKIDEEQVMSESDSEAENQLIEFVQMQTLTSRNYTALFKDDNMMLGHLSSKKKLQSSVGRSKFVRYFKKGNQVSKAISVVEPNGLATQKQDEVGESPSQGFLSIVKINAKSTSNETHGKESVKIQVKNSRKIVDEDNREKYEDEIKHPIFKENLLDNFVKVGKLISEKEMALEKLRQKKLKIQEFLSSSKSYNNFLKTTNYPIDKKFML